MIIKLIINMPDTEVDKLLEKEGLSRADFEAQARLGFGELMNAEEMCPGATCTVEIEG